MSSRPPIPKRLRLLVAAAILGLLALVPAVAGAKMTAPTNYYFVAGGKARVGGILVSGYDGKSVLVSLSTSVGTLEILHTSTGITPSFGYGLSGKELLFTGTQDQVNLALMSLALTTPQPAQKVTKPGVATTPVVISGMAAENKAGVAYYPATQHFYQYVAAANTPWRDVNTTQGADTLAKAATQFGQNGYLASITSADENSFVANKLEGAGGNPAKNVWIGANDITTEGAWVWSGGPENGVQFWSGAETGSAVESRYSNWATGEPNNYANGAPYDTGENCAVINKLNIGAPISQLVPGLWNDLPCNIGAVGTANTIEGYIVEYGNKASGGDFANVDFISKSITRNLPVTVPDPNVLENLFKKKSVSKKAKILPKKKGVPATFSVKLKVQMNVAGTYVIYLKRPDGKGVPFEFQPGSKVAVGKGLFPKTTKLNKPEWTVQVKTAKDNETVTVTPILKTNDWAKPGGTRVFFALLAPNKASKNQMCLANWCQSSPIPVPKRK